MLSVVSTYWPHVLAFLSVALGVPAAIHATMTKNEVRSALGWVGIIILSPVIGPLIYAVGGINRMRRATIGQQRSTLTSPSERQMERFNVTAATLAARVGDHFAAMKILGDRVTGQDLRSGNHIVMLEGGDAAYAAMLSAIAGAQRSILLETYIFDHDPVGLRFADALIAAHRRGVAVRVLIDAVGARYSVPSIVGHLRAGGVPVRLFNGKLVMGLRLPYANLRTHRKILVVDGAVAFTGGMNIRSGFTAEFAGDRKARDTHFEVVGPVVSDLLRVAGDDWQFSSREALTGEAWQTAAPDASPETVETMLARAVPSGPDKANEANHKMIMGAFSVARRRIRIMSPYFLPDRELISALVTACMRGVEVDIIVPGVNNLRLVDRAMTAQFDQTLKGGCRIWRSNGAFNHSKLMTVDDAWAYIGSSNLDQRSLRLNFEIDLEVMDEAFVASINSRIDETLENADPVTLDGLARRPFAERLLNRIFWLGSPYL